MAFTISLRRRQYDGDGKLLPHDKDSAPEQPAFESRDQNPAIVRFGYDTVCDVRVPPERRIKQRHCTLIYTGSGFRLDFEGDANVFINKSNQAAISLCDPFLGNGSEIMLRLGEPVPAPESPGVDIIIRRKDPGANARPTDRKPPKRSNDLVDNFQRHRERQRLLWWSVAAGLVVVVPFAVWFFGDLTAKVERLETYSTAVIDEIKSDVVGSVGLIGVQPASGAFQSVGTGWLCCADNNGYVVTNAHVVAQAQSKLDVAGPGARMTILFPPPADGPETAQPTIVELTRADQFRNPRYDDFEDFMRSKVGDSRSVANVYDVAGFVLPRAEIQKLQAEKRRFFALLEDSAVDEHSSVARPLAVAGYPFENVPLAINADSVVPKVFGSSIVRRTNAFVGAWSGKDNMPPLLASTAESAGGISGSPLVVRVGKNDLRVAGLLMGGSFSADWRGSGGDLERSVVSNVVFGTDVRAIRGALFPEPAPADVSDDQRRQTYIGQWDEIRNRRNVDPLMAKREEFREIAQQAGCDLATITEEPRVFDMRNAIKSEVPGAASGRASESLGVRFEPLQQIALLARSPTAPDQIVTISAAGAAFARDQAGAGVAMLAPPISDKPGDVEFSIRGNHGVQIFAIVMKCRRPS